MTVQGTATALREISLLFPNLILSVFSMKSGRELMIGTWKVAAFIGPEVFLLRGNNNCVLSFQELVEIYVNRWYKSLCYDSRRSFNPTSLIHRYVICDTFQSDHEPLKKQSLVQVFYWRRPKDSCFRGHVRSRPREQRRWQGQPQRGQQRRSQQGQRPQRGRRWRGLGRLPPSLVTVPFTQPIITFVKFWPTPSLPLSADVIEVLTLNKSCVLSFQELVELNVNRWYKSLFYDSRRSFNPTSLIHRCFCQWL